MILLITTVVLAADDPTSCDPERHTSSPDAGGYCLDEQTFSDWLKIRANEQGLKVEVASLEAEIQAFEAWKATRDRLFEEHLSAVVTAHEKGLDLVVAACEEDLRDRNWMDRNGFAIGVAVGFVGAIAVTYGTVELFDAAL